MHKPGLHNRTRNLRDVEQQTGSVSRAFIYTSVTGFHVSINVGLGFACYQQQDVDAPSVCDETVMGESSSVDKCRLSTSKSRHVIQLQQLNSRQTERVSQLFTQLTPKPLKHDYLRNVPPAAD